MTGDEMFVYDVLAEDLLQFCKRPLTHETRRDILKKVLTGLVELHDRRIHHTDIKPSNILVDYNQVPGQEEPTITQVRISDLEDAVLLPPAKSLKGCLCGNELWRRPESWARAKQNLTSNIYSFAIVAIYVMLDHMVFLATNEELKGDMAWWHVLRKHIMYFGDVDGFNGLVEHIGKENPFYDRLFALAAEFGDKNPRRPFAEWEGVDDLRVSGSDCNDEPGPQAEDHGEGGSAAPLVPELRFSEINLEGPHSLRLDSEKQLNTRLNTLND